MASNGLRQANNDDDEITAIYFYIKDITRLGIVT